MPTISRFYGISIKMYYNEHNPPHFHALYQNEEVAIEIESQKIIAGNFPRRALKMVLEWGEFTKQNYLKIGI